MGPLASTGITDLLFDRQVISRYCLSSLVPSPLLLTRDAARVAGGSLVPHLAPWLHQEMLLI